MWRNIMKSIKSQKVSILHYSIDERERAELVERGKVIRWNLDVQHLDFVWRGKIYTIM
jgi:hypothetical protein